MYVFYIQSAAAAAALCVDILLLLFLLLLVAAVRHRAPANRGCSFMQIIRTA